MVRVAIVGLGGISAAHSQACTTFFRSVALADLGDSQVLPGNYFTR